MTVGGASAVALVMERAGGPGASIPREGPEERERGMAPDRIERIGKDVAEPVFHCSK
jgi:hypothetical protein